MKKDNWLLVGIVVLTVSALYMINKRATVSMPKDAEDLSDKEEAQEEFQAATGKMKKLKATLKDKKMKLSDIGLGAGLLFRKKALKKAKAKKVG